MKTKQEIIKETKQYYLTHRRGINPITNTCKYYIKGGAKCAVGRCVENPKALPECRMGDAVDEFDDLDSFLKPEYRGHDSDFWQMLQSFHHGIGLWLKTKRGNSLTPLGEQRYQKLLTQYAD